MKKREEGRRQNKNAEGESLYDELQNEYELSPKFSNQILEYEAALGACAQAA
jgi:hypothetical protein